MKSAYIFLLLSASLCSAQPIRVQKSLLQHQEVLVDSVHGRSQPYKLHGSILLDSVREPALREYIRLHEEAESLEISSPLQKTGDKSKCFLDRYGSFVGKYFTSSRRFSASSQIVTYTRTASLLDMFSRYGPECVMLSIFVLFPIAYFLLELFEVIYRCCAKRGKTEQDQDMCRSSTGVYLLGPERQLRVWSDDQLYVDNTEKDSLHT